MYVSISRMMMHGDGVGTTFLGDPIWDGICAIMVRLLDTSFLFITDCVVICEVIMTLDIFWSSLWFCAAVSSLAVCIRLTALNEKLC